LADLSLIFSLVWKIWLLFVIQWISYLIEKVFTHTHTHCMSWVIYLKFLSARKFVLIEYLTLIYIFAYFCNVIWLLYQLIIHACSEANFWEKYFSPHFPQVSDFQVLSIRTDLFFVQMRAVFPYVDLAVAHLDRISIGLRLASHSLPYTHLWIIIDLSYHVVCFSGGILPRFWQSLHISSHPMIFIVSSVILLSFCAFRILEYLLIGIFAWDNVHKNLLCLCVGWILLYPCYLDCYIYFCNSYASRLQVVIIPHSFWN
jgi:hypothetical protein